MTEGTLLSGRLGHRLGGAGNDGSDCFDELPFFEGDGAGDGILIQLITSHKRTPCSFWPPLWGPAWVVSIHASTLADTYLQRLNFNGHYNLRLPLKCLSPRQPSPGTMSQNWSSWVMQLGHLLWEGSPDEETKPSPSPPSSWSGLSSSSGSPWPPSSKGIRYRSSGQVRPKRWPRTSGRTASSTIPRWPAASQRRATNKKSSARRSRTAWKEALTSLFHRDWWELWKDHLRRQPESLPRSSSSACTP